MSERTSAARAALMTLFMRGIAARVPASKERINEAMDELEASVHETYTPAPDMAGASVADVVGTDANGSPIVGEISPPPAGKPTVKAKSTKK